MLVRSVLLNLEAIYTMLINIRSREAAMPFIMLAVLIDMAAIGVIVPVLPTLVASFATTQADQAFWYGVVAAAFGLANFVASPILGALSDRFGRRPVMLLGFMGLGLSFFGTAMSTSLIGLIIARTLGGAMQANVAIAMPMWPIFQPPKSAPSGLAFWAP